MAQNCVKLYSLFEVSACCKYPTDIVCLAANIYHKFSYAIDNRCNEYDVYSLVCACLRIAVRASELHVNNNYLIIAFTRIIHGQDFTIDDKILEKCSESIDLLEKVILRNIQYRIDYSIIRKQTPGQLSVDWKRKRESRSDIALFDSEYYCDIEFKEFVKKQSTDIASLERVENLRTPSAHHYLSHYLYCISQLCDYHNKDETEEKNEKSRKMLILIANIAWTFLTDCHLSPLVVIKQPDHLAVASFMMAVEVVKDEFEQRPLRYGKMWVILNRRWNLIFCDNLTNKQLIFLIRDIAKVYERFEIALMKELQIFTSDPRAEEYDD